MSYNGSGTFQINTSGQPVVAGTVISSTAFNALTADLATGLSTAITKDGQTATTVRIPFAQGINSSLTTDSSSTSTGSIITAGGVGIAKALYVGTNANVAGTLAVTGVATFSAAPIYSSLTASSAVATDASKALVSVTNTGTGNNVLATSPTLVTPVLGVASATSITVAAGTVSDPAITTTGDTNTGIFFPAADTIAFAEGGAEVARFDSSGNLGIGTTPLEKCNIYASSGNSFYKFQNAATGSGATDGGFVGIGSSGDVFLYNYEGSNTIFATNNAERMRIDSSGNLLVGTTSNFSADKLCLNFTSAQNGLGIRDDSNSSGALYAVFRNSANGVIGNIARVTTTNAVVYNTTSDQRLKSNIADASPVLDKLMAVKVRQFDWTEGDLHQDAGFIAQELAPVLSGIVTEGRTEDDLWQLDYARLTPYLVKAIQEQQALITALTTQITAQQASLDSLTARITALEAK